MNLIIDIGNTSAKVAVYRKSKLLKKAVVSHNDWLTRAQSYLNKHKRINNAIVSTVGGSFKKDIHSLKKDVHLVVLSSKTKVPFQNRYTTPTTLGVDRIALAAAACGKYSNKNVLVIDAGTCITYDLVTNQNEYLGGGISPGIRLRYTSLNNLTANLPLLTKKNPSKIIGNSTNTAIHSGVIYGVSFEIDGVIEHYMDDYEDLTVILTGGDAKFLSKRLKNSIFANSNFLLEGLNNILEFNT
ncbi:MAG: type III pantothenate kinase [bacterium]